MPVTLNRNAIPVLAIVAVAGLAMSACKEKAGDGPSSPASGQPSSVVDQMGDAGKQAADAVREQTAAARDAFVEGASTQLRNLEREVETFIASARERMPSANAEVNRLRDELNNSLAKARVELEKVRNAGADAWKDSSAAFQEAMAEVQRSFNAVKEQLQSAMPSAPSTPPAPNK
jgi:predicted  nucleic acid-binding Zn-ribbon protein